MQRLHPEPVVPALLVGAEQEAEVVHLETRRPALIARLEPGDPSAHFAEEQLLRVARERRPGRVEGESGVEALVVMHRVPLRRGDGGGRARHPAQVERARDLIAAPQEPVPEVHRTDVRVTPQRGVGQGVEAAVHRREHHADAALTLAEILLPAQHRIVGRGLGGAIGAARGALRNPFEQAHCLTARQPAGQLAREVDRGSNGRASVIRRELRRPPDTTRVEQPLTVAVHLAAVHVEAEDPCARDEEGTALLEEGLEGREVEDGGVGLHLPEVRVDGGVERQVGGEPVFQVRPSCELLGPIKAVAGCDRHVLRHRVGRDLQSARCGESHQTGDVPQLGGEARLRLPVHRPGDPLRVPLDVAPHGEAERVRVRMRVAQLRQRYLELRRPAERVHGRRHLPYAVPGIVLVVVVVDRVIALHSGRVDRELVAGAPVVVGVDDDLELIRRRPHVATRQDLQDAVGMGIEGADERVEVVVVVGDLGFRGEPRVTVLPRRELAERRDGGCLAPHLVVVLAVDDHGADCPPGDDRGGGGRRRLAGFGGGAAVRLDDDHDDEHRQDGWHTGPLGVPGS